MADKNNTFVNVPDETTNQIKLPEYAMESTQEQMIELLEKILAGDKKQQEHYKKVIKGAKESSKKDEKANKEADKDRNDQLEALKDIRDSNEDIAEGKSGLLGLFGGIGLAIGLTTTAIGAMTGLLWRASTRLGDYSQELVKGGVGFDDATGSLMDMTVSLQQMGFTIEEAQNLLTQFNGAITVLGKGRFTEIQQAFASMTANGTKFGMTLAEASDILAEDLETRKQLGILEGINGNAAAKRSADLYQMQLEATTLLGKSIDDIRGSSDSLLADNAQVQLKILGIANSLSPEAAARFTNSIEKMTSELSAMGVDQSLINQLGNEMLDVTSFMSGAGQELFAALSATGQEGSALAQTISNINKAVNSGNIEAAERMMAQVPKQMSMLAKNMDSKQIQQFSVLLKGLGPAGEAFALSLAQMQMASNRTAASLDKDFPELAKQVAVVEQAVKGLKGQLSAVLTSITAELAGPMSNLVEAFSDVTDEAGNVTRKGIFSAFNDAVLSVKDTVVSVFGNDGIAGATKDWAQIIRDQALPAIRKIADWINEKIINNFSDFSLRDWLTSTKDAAVDMFSKVGTLIDDAAVFGVSLRNLAGLINRVFGRFFDKETVAKNSSEQEEFAALSATRSNLTEARANRESQLARARSNDHKARLQKEIREIDGQLAVNSDAIALIKTTTETSFNTTKASLTAAGAVGTLAAASAAKTVVATKMTAKIVGEGAKIAKDTSSLTKGALASTKLIAKSAAVSASGVLSAGLVLKDIFDVATGTGGGANAENVGAIIGTAIGGALGLAGGPIGVAIGAGLGNTIGEWAGMGIDKLMAPEPINVDNKQEKVNIDVDAAPQLMGAPVAPGALPSYLYKDGRTPPTPATPAADKIKEPLAQAIKQVDKADEAETDTTNDMMLALMNEVAANTKSTDKKLRELIELNK